jgi:hypothetical protein
LEILLPAIALKKWLRMKKGNKGWMWRIISLGRDGVGMGVGNNGLLEVKTNLRICRLERSERS